MRRLISGCALTIGFLALAACDAETANPITSGPLNDSGADGTQPVMEAGAGDEVQDSGSILDSGVPRTGDASDGGSSTDTGPSDAGNAGTALATGTNITLVGITSQNMVIYSDGTSYYGVPLGGGATTNIAPMAAIDHVVISGPIAFLWGASTELVFATGCPGCGGQFSAYYPGFTVLPTSVNGVFSPIASADGAYFAAVGKSDTYTPPDGGPEQRPSLFLVQVSDGLARYPAVEDLECIDIVRFAQNDDLFATYSAYGAPVASAGVRSVFRDSPFRPPLTVFTETIGSACATTMPDSIAPSGEWLFTRPPPGLDPNARISHVPDGVIHDYPANLPDGGWLGPDGVLFDDARSALYIYGTAVGLLRVSLTDFTTTTVPPNTCNYHIGAISPDGNYALSGDCGGGVVSLQSGAFTALPSGPGVHYMGMTDDWSFVYWQANDLNDGGTNLTQYWTERVGSFAPVLLGTAGLQVFTVEPLSGSTLIVRDGSVVQVFDATGGTPPVLVASTVAAEASAWALSSDRKAGAYVTQTAPAGLYAVAIP